MNLPSVPPKRREQGHTVLSRADYKDLRERVDPERIYTADNGREYIFGEFRFDDKQVVFVEDWPSDL